MNCFSNIHVRYQINRWPNNLNSDYRKADKISKRWGSKRTLLHRQ